ncbi:mmoS [Asticcacaulis biprosthecium C19]|uniref:histidine kinase n=1 Tax=Asticcacaulis biprosthecium C19 TaxID=715226 RepID=F4QN47_9CAUL|nr:PAS domain S-box protein [Asticcacaulis biprosthecium]EGF91638.1 mmoS [Asticcacaulis biprosthecium C19]
MTEAAFELAPCGLVVCDNDGTIVAANRYFRAMSGYDGGPKTFGRCLTRPSQFILSAKLLPELNLTGEASEIALSLTGPDGDSVPILLNARRDGDHFHYAVFPAKERREYETEYLNAKKKLTQYSDYLRMAERLAHLGHWHGNMVTKETYWSPETYAIFGCDPETFTPRFGETMALYHPDDREEIRAIVEAAIAGNGEFSFRARCIRHDSGEIRHIETNGVCERDESGKAIGLFGVVHDLSDILSAQEATEASEARYRLLADSSNDIISVFGLDGAIEYLSPAVEKLLGFTPAELTGRNVRDIVLPEDYPVTRAAFASYVRGGDWSAVPRVQYRARHKQGHIVWLEASPRAMLGPDGKIAKLQDVVRDITERKAVEAALEDAMVDANAAAEAKSQFLATMSHELRTPLTSIIGFSALLREVVESEEPRRYSQRIWTASQGLLALINDILDHSKLEAGQLELDLAPCSANELMQEVADLLEVQAHAKGLFLTVDTDDDMPLMLLDEVRMRQILINLAGNAVKFTGDGGVTIALHWRGDRLQVTVTDTGPGISPEGHKRLFKRFSQVDHTTNGTGLGLMICKQLVELMGGRIGVESSPGNGSMFWFDIPVQVCDGEDADEAGTEVATGTGYILMADDHAGNRDLILSLMRARGYYVDAVADGGEALQACLERRYDLILMDVNMPVMDGLVATQGIRASSELNARTPIIGVSAGGESRRRICLGAGMNDMVEKPIRPGVLTATVAEWLAHSQGDLPHARIG